MSGFKIVDSLPIISIKTEFFWSWRPKMPIDYEIIEDKKLVLAKNVHL